jgi:plastocyanin
MKKLFGVLVVVSLIAIIVSACSLPGLGGNTATGPNPVHMGETDFKVSSITIQKGTKITLINDDAPIHVIANGTWDDMTPKPKVEAGAPTIDNLQVDGYGSNTIGPFNTAGTFQIYCTVHPKMKLTVIVK